MALQVTQGTGTFVATVDVGGGVHSPCMTLITGTSAIGSVLVTGTSAITGAVSISGTPSVSVVGTATISGPVTISGTPAVTLSAGTASIGSVSVTGTSAITGAVTISGTPSVTVSGTATVAGTVAVSSVSGTSAISGAVSISGTPAVTISGTATVSPITISQMGTAAVVAAGLAGTLAVGGGAATNAVITTNPVNQGAQAVSSENSTATTGRMVQLVADLAGKLIVMPYANPENFISAVTPAINGTQTNTLFASPGGSLRNYVTSLSVTNSVNTGTVVSLKDGTSGTSIFSAFVGTQTAGSLLMTFPTPLRQPTAGTALNCFNVSTGASVIISAQGYKGV